MVWSEVIPNEPEGTWIVCPAWEGISEQIKYYASSQNYLEGFHMHFLSKNVSYKFYHRKEKPKTFW